MSPREPSAEALALKLHQAIERVLRWLPHLNPVGRALRVIVLDDRAQPDARTGRVQRQPPGLFDEPHLISEREGLLIPSSRLAQMSKGELLWLIAHEMIHVYFRHPERGQGRDPALWQQASDYEANSALKDAGVPLSSDALYDESLAGLSAEALYERFRSQRRPQSARGAGSPKHEWEHTRSAWGAPHGAPLLTVKVSDVAQRGATVSLTQDAGDKASRGDPPCARLERGFGAHQLEESLAYRAQSLSQSANPWATLLRDFMRHRALRRSASRYRRRDIGRDLYLPSMRGDGIKLAVALDTSGSTQALLPDFLHEVERVLEACPHFNLTLIQCSYEISATDEMTHRDLPRIKTLKLQGGGGTRFQPVFDLFDRTDQRLPNLLIYLTDGRGPHVDRAPNFPVIWVLSDGGKRPASFGVELPLTQGAHRRDQGA